MWSGSAKNYVAKRYIEAVPRRVYFDDVKLQMDAKLWGEEYNRYSPPKPVSDSYAHVTKACKVLGDCNAKNVFIFMVSSGFLTHSGGHISNVLTRVPVTTG